VCVYVCTGTTVYVCVCVYVSVWGDTERGGTLCEREGWIIMRCGQDRIGELMMDGIGVTEGRRLPG